ncbi:hypothetical protein PSI22_13870 [Xenorhabdus sp. XENO-7]|uniref:Uncharacterized protein n=1 Tax=Xenorhabdus aichiensis TaxID=3025874 RepID=A0ABT5M8Z0_9GAMM|nr:hypothetical protein [Xenorhabdus aichiensis]MDC9622692.1 hypothetical protein [Xenorhabdus aichiensis]
MNITEAGSHKEAIINNIILTNYGEVEISVTLPLDNDVRNTITVNLYSKITGPTIGTGTAANPDSIIALMQYTGILHHYSGGKKINFTKKDKSGDDKYPRIDSITLDDPGTD